MLKILLITLIINSISSQNKTEQENTEKELNITDENISLNKTNENQNEKPEEKLSDFNETLRELNNTNFTKYNQFMSDIKNITLYEKDRILSCIELSSMLIDAEEDYINGNLTQNSSFKRQGMKEIISMEMMKRCINNINETLVNLMYKNLTRIVNLSGIDDSEIEYMKVNYSYYGHLDFFQINEEYQKFILRINYVRDEYVKKWEEPIPEEEIEKRRKEKEKLQKELIEMLRNRTYNNSNFTESEEDEDDSFMYDSSVIYKYDENGNFVEVNATEERLRKRKEREEKKRKEKEEKEKKEKEGKNDNVTIDNNNEIDNKINNDKGNDNKKEKNDENKEEKNKKENEKKNDENKEEKDKKDDEKSDL